MCKLLVQHIVIDLVEYLINEVKEGLKTLGVLEAIEQNPEKFREVFGKENMPNWMHVWLTSCFLQISTRRYLTNAHYKRRLLYIGGLLTRLHEYVEITFYNIGLPNYSYQSLRGWLFRKLVTAVQKCY